jgi:Zn-dependent peptidase ImmA (M78 family)
MELNLDQTVNDASKVIVCRRNSISNENNRSRQIRDWREWQADYLAACLLMPPLAIRNVANSVKIKHQDTARSLFRHANGSEHDLMTATLINEVSDTFQVSCLAAEVRLKQLNLLSLSCNDQIPIEALAL